LRWIIAQRYREPDASMDEKVVDFRAKVGSFSEKVPHFLE